MKRLLLLACLLLVSLNVDAYGFELKDTQGKMQRLSDYKGKWVLVNFWATWCPPCLDEIPDLIELHNARKSTDFVVIGIAMSSTWSSVLSYSKQLGITYPIIFGDEKTAAQIGQVSALPTSYLYDPTGKLVSYQRGMLSRVAIESYILSKTGKQ